MGVFPGYAFLSGGRFRGWVVGVTGGSCMGDGEACMGDGGGCTSDGGPVRATEGPGGCLTTPGQPPGI